MFIKTDLKYGNGIEINEFRGRISLIAATEKNGKVYQKWGDVEIGKDNKKRLPVAVDLGDNKEMAISTLRAVIAFLQREKPVPDDGQRDDVPF